MSATPKLSPERLGAVLDGLRALLAEATPGPWYVNSDSCAPYLDSIYPADQSPIRRLANDVQRTDSALIVTAVNAFPALLVHCKDVMQRHEAVEVRLESKTHGGGPEYGLACGDCRHHLVHIGPWPCPEIASLTALLTPYRHLAEGTE